MEIKDAIKILQVAKAEVEWSAPLDYQEAFDVSISALEKQIPRKYIVHNGGYDCEGSFLGSYNCPSCDYEFDYLGEIFCPSCGQKILWE